MSALTTPEALAVLVVATAAGLVTARFLAYREVPPRLSTDAGILIFLVTFAARLLVGPDTNNARADVLVCVGAGLVLGAAAYARYDHWQDKCRERLQSQLERALKDTVVIGPDPRDPRDLAPGEPAMQVMPRAIERAINRRERRDRRKS